MSCVRTVKTFEVVEIKLDEIKANDLIELEETLCNVMVQKLEKLNILIKETNIYSHNGCLLINDRYRICADLEEIARAFGFEIKKINCTLRGNNYIVSDALVSLLKEIGVSYAFGESIANQTATEEIKAIIENNAISETIKGDLLEIAKNIRQNGSYTMTKTREVVTEYYDDQFRGQTKGAWDSNEGTVQTQLKAFVERSKQTVSKANVDMLNGTTKLIYSRARQMGYAVEEVKKGKDVQLVLVRLQ
jgi:uncharacterized protein (UPF0335 family)